MIKNIKKFLNRKSVRYGSLAFLITTSMDIVIFKVKILDPNEIMFMWVFTFMIWVPMLITLNFLFAFIGERKNKIGEKIRIFAFSMLTSIVLNFLFVLIISLWSFSCVASLNPSDYCKSLFRLAI